MKLSASKRRNLAITKGKKLANRQHDGHSHHFSFFSKTPHTCFCVRFSMQKVERSFQIIDVLKDDLLSAWGQCVGDSISAGTSVENEPQKPRPANVGPPDGHAAFSYSWSLPD